MVNLRGEGSGGHDVNVLYLDLKSNDKTGICTFSLLMKGHYCRIKKNIPPLGYY